MKPFKHILILCRDAGNKHFNGDLIIPSTLPGLKLTKAQRKLLDAILEQSDTRLSAVKDSQVRRFRQAMLEAIRVAVTSVETYDHRTSDLDAGQPMEKRAAQASVDLRPVKRRKLHSNDQRPVDSQREDLSEDTDEAESDNANTSSNGTPDPEVHHWVMEGKRRPPERRPHPTMSKEQVECAIQAFEKSFNKRATTPAPCE